MFLPVAGRPVLPRQDRAAQRRRTRFSVPAQDRVRGDQQPHPVAACFRYHAEQGREQGPVRPVQVRATCLPLLQDCELVAQDQDLRGFHVSSRWDSRSHAASRIIRRNTNRRPMIDDHQGPSAGRANLLARAMDGILGTHRQLLPGRRRCAMRAPRLTSRCPGFRCSGQPHPRAGSGGGPSGPSRSRQTSPDPHPSAAGKRQVRSGGPVLAWRSGCSDMSPAWRAGSVLRRTGPCRNG